MKLSQALMYTERIDWTTNPLFEAVLQKHTNVVHNTLATRGVRTKVYSQSGILYMESEAAEQVDPSAPEDVFLSTLETKHVPFIYSVWAHNDIYTSSELEDTVRLNGGIGVFSSNDDLPLAWVMHTHYGGVGVLQTRSDQLKKGYGSLVTKGITHVMGKMGICPHACIMDKNSKSLALFKSIGYKRVSDIQYISSGLSLD
uniref:GCN5-related N-acetyltransferase Rv2170-like domain-containing protein n=2 Tax=Clastoptera arizonana TaxID=38151 RepID=A0A1B6DSX8_9HEMI